MTAIAGFNCLDGVLMLSDSEETTSSFTKSDCDKLYPFSFPIGTVLTGGAGDGHLIDCANQELHQFFARGGAETSGVPLDGEQIRLALNEFAREFFEKTVGPSQGSLEMLIAVNHHKRQTLLFHWNKNRVLWIPPERHECIGSGAIQLHPMLRDFQFSTSIETALFCGLGMMFHAKRIVQGVGGKTDAIALLHNGIRHTFGTANTERIESLVSNFEQFLTKFVYTTVSNVHAINPKIQAELDENAERSFSLVSEEFRRIREHYRELLEHPIL